MSNRTVLLIHGGLYEPMDARRFWVEPGVVEGLETRGLRVLAPDRLVGPTSWQEEAAFLANVLAKSVVEPVTAIAGSNGCSAALLLALDSPVLVKDLVLCWPVTSTAHDPRSSLWQQICESSGEAAASSLLGGETIRGVSDDELRSIVIPVAVMAADPENPIHRHKTVHELLHLLANCRTLPSFPETPRREFPSQVEDYVAAILS